MSEHTLALDHLPVELLYEIHLFALSPALPITSKHLHAVFKLAPTTIHAEWLIECWRAAADLSWPVKRDGFVSYALRFPICTRNVLEAMWRIPKLPFNPAHQVTILPRRLFRNLAPRNEPGQPPWTVDDEPIPFLRYLCTHPEVPRVVADSYDGYALTRAVYACFKPLVRVLLDLGVSPTCKQNLAVMVAIRQRNLSLVRMLIERDYRNAELNSAPPRKRRRLGVGRASDIGSSDGREALPGGSTSTPSGSGKRRKLADRVTVNSDMLKLAVKCDARDIVEYFMKEKGCVPDMQTVLMMSR
ncbi:hypothetical protein L227DRAFT_611866 [Lentinus tigrinus ALCF2SS1-6]|uniref:Uncharacterized protein n=2 Tax=Lentinus tigrinus TaxID=5365 RepID=A0A5C2S922_9APHY|nr:hypothetical protein L227DRAFT_611866 [Lentinus tigrinus ALCF2SS1-6]